MITTLEIPDPLYRKLAAKSAQLGADVASITLRLYREWVEEPSLEINETALAGGQSPSDRATALDAWVSSATETLSKAPPGPTARELLMEGRANRIP